MPSITGRAGVAIFTVATVVLALGASTTAVSARTAKASASCGTEHTEGGPAHIIAHGVSCARARKVIHDFATKGAFWHFVGTNHANGYSPVDGWRCTLFMGHSECKRGHAVIRGEPLPPGHAAPLPSNPTEFRVRLAGGTFGCAVGEIEETVCFGAPTTPEGSTASVQVAKLQLTGQVTTCVEHGSTDDHCFEGNLGDPIPYLSPGQQTTVGPFTCKVLESGVECTVMPIGKGFLITLTTTMSVGA